MELEGVPKVQFFGTAGTAVPQFLSAVPIRSVKWLTLVTMMLETGFRYL